MSDGRPIHCYEYVNRPYAMVRDMVAADPAALFGPAGAAAASRVQSIAAGLRVDMGAFAIEAGIDVEVGDIVHDTPEGSTMRHQTRMPIRWKAARASALFPTMDAELRLYPLSPDETQLDLVGHYHPPGGALGTAADVVLGHRIAEASIHRFLREIAERLQMRLAGG